MSKANILIVEDDAVSANVLSFMLTKLDYEVIDQVSSGEEAIAVSLTQRPDLILMDINLRGDIDGIQAAQQIRDQVDIPVVYLTAYSDSVTLERAKITKPYGYVLKPFEARTLSTAVEMGLNEHRLEQEIKQNEARFRTSVENLLDCFAIYQAVRDTSNRINDFKITYVNPAACKNDKLTREEQSGKSFTDLFPTHFSSGLFAMYAQVVYSGNTLELDSFIYEPGLQNQSVRKAYDIRATKLEDGVAVAWRDVSERQNLMETLRKNERRTQALLRLYQKPETTSVEIIQEAVQQALELSESELSMIGILENGENHIEAHFWSRTDLQNQNPERHIRRVLLSDFTPWNQVILNQQTVVINNSEAERISIVDLPAEHKTIHRFVGIPIVRNGRVVMIYGMANKSKEYQHEDISQVSLFMEGVWERIYQSKIEERIEGLARFPAENPNPILRISPQGEVLYANDPAFLLLPKQVTSEKVFVPQSWMQYIVQAYETAKHHDFETQIEAEHYLVSISPINHLGYMNIYAQNNTVRKKAEIALRESEEVYRTLFATVSDAILVFDAETLRIIDFNESALKLYGYTRNELLQLNFSNLTDPKKSGESKFPQKLGLEIVRSTLQFQLKKNGSSFPVELSASIFSIQTRAVICAVVRDITETMQHTLEMEFMNQVSASLRSVITKNEMLPLIVDMLVNMYQANLAALSIVDPISGKGIIEIAHGIDNLSGQVTPNTPIFTARIIQNPGTKIIDDQYIPPGIEQAPAVICVPLIYQNQALSIIWIGRTIFFTEYDIRSLEAVAGIAANALQRALTLETLEQRVADRTRELATLYNVASIVTEEHELQPMLKRALELTLQTLDINRGAIHLVNEQETSSFVNPMLFLTVEQGLSKEEHKSLESVPFGKGLPGYVIQNNQSLVSTNLESDSIDVRKSEGPRNYSYLGVPMRIHGNEIIGVISVYRQSDGFFRTEEIALLSTIADEIAVIIENVRLRKQTEQSAVLEERQRLARELHDSATQALYSLTLFASACRELVQKGDLDRLSSNIEKINLISLQALKEMRLLIYELHPPTLKGDGLVNALQQRLDAVERRASVKTRLLISGEIELPSAVAFELNRIAQEALNNILKHAAATAVTVHIRAKEEEIELEISDNGIGFIPSEALEQGGLGLQSLSERTGKLNGSLTILTAPGEGTKISVRIPTLKNTER